MKLVLELLEFLIGREALVKLILMFSDLFFEELKTKLTNIMEIQLEKYGEKNELHNRNLQSAQSNKQFTGLRLVSDRS